MTKVTKMVDIINDQKVIFQNEKNQKIRVSGNIIELRSYAKLPDKMPIQKLSDTEYLVTATGEIKEYDLSENRSDNLNSISNSMADARAIINANFRGGINELWFTLTYAENMQDVKRLYLDYKNFMKRVRYEMHGQNLDYIVIAEPQERGAWHLHGLLRASDDKQLYIHHDVLKGLWGHGSVDVKRLKGIDNIGAYISAYCSNMPSNDPDSKTYKKHQRLRLYPKGMNFYRYSKGLEKPEWHKPTMTEKMIAEFGTLCYQKGIEILDDDGTVLNRIIYKQYNMARKINK